MTLKLGSLGMWPQSSAFCLLHGPIFLKCFSITCIEYPSNDTSNWYGVHTRAVRPLRLPVLGGPFQEAYGPRYMN